MQKFIARERFDYPNGATGWAPGGMMDCLGPYAKVENCPIDGTGLRRTAYATGYASTMFSVPAATRYKGQYIGGFFALDDGDIKFCPYDRFLPRLHGKGGAPMDVKAIKYAVDAGHVVHWSNDGYRVVKDTLGQYLIKFRDGDCIGLTHQDGVTLNGAESDFYITE